MQTPATISDHEIIEIWFADVLISITGGNQAENS